MSQQICPKETQFTFLVGADLRFFNQKLFSASPQIGFVFHTPEAAVPEAVKTDDRLEDELADDLCCAICLVGGTTPRQY